MFNAIRVSRLITITATAALSVAFLAGVSSPANAQTIGGEDKATVTFDRPVEVPGKVLSPGTYVFKSLDNNELVQVFSADQKHLFATLSAIPADRPVQDVSSDCFVQLNKTRADAPQEVEGFFLPGRQTGLQFIYPAAHASHHGL